MMSKSISRAYVFPMQLTPTRAFAVSLIVLLLGCVLAPQAHAKRVDPLADLSRDERQVFQNYTRLFCSQFFRYEKDRFVILPNHYRKRENSAGRSFDQALEEMTETRIVKVGLNTVEKKFPPPNGEVVATALVIPMIDVGHYGFVASVTVQEIIGADEMIVTDLILIPEDQVGKEKNNIRKDLVTRQKEYKKNGMSFRLLGFNTAKLKAGEVYTGKGGKGLHLAVMSTDPKHDFVLVNYDKLERVRTHEFPEVLSYVQFEPLAFIDLVRDNRERLVTDGDKASLITIYRRFYDRYRPKRLTRDAARIEVPKPEINKPEIDEPAVVEPKVDEPEIDEPKVDVPRPKPIPPRKEEEEDDWEFEEEEANDSEEPTFFGIPL